MIESLLSTKTRKSDSNYPKGWVRLADAPVSFRQHSLIHIEDHLFAFGNLPASNQLFKYSIINDSWEELFPLGDKPSKRRYATTVNINNKLYTYSGYDGFDIGDLWCYDPRNNSWSQGTSGRIAHGGSSVNLDNKLVTIGGFVYNTITTLNSVSEYDPITDAWRDLPNLPSRSVYGSATTWRDSIYVYGIYTGSIYQPNLYEYNRVRNTWVNKAQWPPGRHSTSLECVGDSLYAFGGNPLRNLNVDNAFARYRIPLNTWESIPLIGEPGVAYPTIRHRHETCTYNDSFFLLGGEDVNGVASSELWVYTP